MDDKKLDQEIKNSLLKNTENTTQNKEEIWKNIESKLAIGAELNRKNTEKSEEIIMNYEPRSNKKAKKKSKGWLTGTVAAALLIGIFTTSTDTGQAFVSNIKEYFAPEKQVVEDIEGMPEEKEVTLQEGKAGYIIYLDEERYTLVHDGEIDKIVTKVPLDEKYPEVSMTIKQIEDKNPAQLAEEISAELKQSFETVKEIETVSDPVEGLLVSAINGSEWDSRVTQVYIISNEKEGSFVIQQNYFLEAAEGHGARFYHMLKEFQIVEIEAE
jgi:hypothetical protein